MSSSPSRTSVSGAYDWAALACVVGLGVTWLVNAPATPARPGPAAARVVEDVQPRVPGCWIGEEHRAVPVAIWRRWVSLVDCDVGRTQVSVGVPGPDSQYGAEGLVFSETQDRCVRRALEDNLAQIGADVRDAGLVNADGGWSCSFAVYRHDGGVQ